MRRRAAVRVAWAACTNARQGSNGRMLCMKQHRPGWGTPPGPCCFIVHVMHAHEVSLGVIPRRVTPAPQRHGHVDESRLATPKRL